MQRPNTPEPLSRCFCMHRKSKSPGERNGVLHAKAIKELHGPPLGVRGFRMMRYPTRESSQALAKHPRMQGCQAPWQHHHQAARASKLSSMQPCGTLVLVRREHMVGSGMAPGCLHTASSCCIKG